MQTYTTEQFWTPMPMSLPALEAIENNGRKIPGEYDGKLLLEVEYCADMEGNFLSRRNVRAVDAKLYFGQVDLGPQSDSVRGQLAAEWLMVESNREFLERQCEADWQKWHRPKPAPLATKCGIVGLGRVSA